jgi:hypothetical protein
MKWVDNISKHSDRVARQNEAQAYSARDLNKMVGWFVGGGSCPPHVTCDDADVSHHNRFLANAP